MAATEPLTPGDGRTCRTARQPGIHGCGQPVTGSADPEIARAGAAVLRGGRRRAGPGRCPGRRSASRWPNSPNATSPRRRCPADDCWTSSRPRAHLTASHGTPSHQCHHVRAEALRHRREPARPSWRPRCIAARDRTRLADRLRGRGRPDPPALAADVPAGLGSGAHRQPGGDVAAARGRRPGPDAPRDRPALRRLRAPALRAADAAAAAAGRGPRLRARGAGPGARPAGAGAVQRAAACSAADSRSA